MLGSILLVACNNSDQNSNSSAVINQMPNIIPSLKFWQGETGFTDITINSHIILNSDDSQTLDILQGTAKIFNEDLLILNGLQLDVIENGGEGEPGDIIFNITGYTPPINDPEAHDESYTVSINGKIVITAPEIRGAAYATATLKQILVQDFDGNDSLPNGNIQDQPVVRVRGFMIDIGRRSVSIDFLKNYLKFLSYYKMSEFQLHLNDNEIIWGDGVTDSNWSENTWQDETYSGFSVELKDTDKFPNLSKITSKRDTANNIFVLSINDLKELKSLADSLGIELTAEIDVPAHSMSLTKVYPDIRNSDMRPDHLDLGNPKTLAIIKEIWDQLSPYFHNLHIGADEYAGIPKEDAQDKDQIASKQMVDYMNTMNSYLKDKGFNDIRVWGNLGTITKLHRPSLNTDLVYEVWSGDFADTKSAYEAGYKLINLNDAYYTVPTGNAGYPDTIDPAAMYTNWDLSTFSGGYKTPSIDDPQFLGAFIANWNDLGWSKNWAYTNNDIHVRMRNVIKIAAQKMWTNSTVLPFEKFQNLAYTLGESPSFTLRNTIYPGNLIKFKSAYSFSYRNIIYRLGKSPDGAKLLTVNFLGHAGAAIDGDSNSRWMAALKDGPSAWLVVDLHHAESISRVSIDWGQGWASEYQIQTSLDGFDWTTVANVNGAGAKNEETTFPTIKTRFVRMQGVTMGNTETYQIHEVRVFK